MKCKLCLYLHKRRCCQAYGKSCNNRKKKGHFTKCSPKFDSKVDSVQQNMDNSDSDSELFNNCKSLFIGLVEDEENSENKWKIDLLGNQTLLSFQIDSGTQANIIPENCFRTLKNKPKLHKPNAKITAYNGSSISVTGPCILNIELKRKTIPILFIVTDVTSQPISTKLNLIK